MADPMGAYSRIRGRRNALFTRWARRSFGAIGPGSVIELPVLVHGAANVTIGSGVHVGSDSHLHAPRDGARIEIGDGCRISGHCVLSAERSVRLGRRVLLARNVYIADHAHGRDDPDLPVMDQELTDIAPVSIGDGAWLGQNVVVLPGVSIGPGAVVGANSVVRDDVPAGAVAVGAPARVVRRPA